MVRLSKNMQLFAWIMFAVITLAASIYFIKNKPIKIPLLESFADLGNTLYMNQSMDPFDALTSANILYKMIYQDDGNLAIIKVSSGKQLWSTNIKEPDVKPGKATMYHDGNCILYDADSKMYWSTGSNRKGSAPYRLEMQNDGTAAIFDTKNEKIWSSLDKK